MSKKTKLITMLALFFVPIITLAFSTKTGNSVYVAENENISGNLYAAGQNITIDGPISGDIICAGQTITVNGNVDGDIICAGQNITINGTVGGNVRLAGSSISLNNTVARNAMTFGATVVLGRNAAIGWDMLIGAATTEIRGRIGRSLHGGGANVLIAGQIDGDVRVDLDGEKRTGLTITRDAVISGNILYKDTKDAAIDSGAQIRGQLSKQMPEKEETKERKTAARGLLGGAIFYSILSSLIIGLILVVLFRTKIEEIINIMNAQIGASIGWGAIILFLAPLIFILLLFTIIGIPLAFILLALWLAALLTAKTITAIMLGKKILGKIASEKNYSLIWAMILGVIVLEIVTFIPIIGWIISFIAILLGLGGLFLFFRQQKKSA